MRVESKHLESILVARDWQLHRRSSVPFGGYIAKGFSKFAFRVCIFSFTPHPAAHSCIIE